MSGFIPKDGPGIIEVLRDGGAHAKLDIPPGPGGYELKNSIAELDGGGVTKDGSELLLTDRGTITPVGQGQAR